MHSGSQGRIPIIDKRSHELENSVGRLRHQAVKDHAGGFNHADGIWLDRGRNHSGVRMVALFREHYPSSTGLIRLNVYQGVPRGFASPKSVLYAF
jgi:hypothetical protein